MKYTCYVCPECGSNDIDFFGYRDGAGDFGEDIEEIWECVDCGYVGDLNYFDMIYEEENTDET